MRSKRSKGFWEIRNYSSITPVIEHSKDKTSLLFTPLDQYPSMRV